MSRAEARLQRHARPEVRVEMDILDAANVGALVNVNPDLKRAGEHIADQVQFVPAAAHIDRLVRIRQCDVQNLAELASARMDHG